MNVWHSALFLATLGGAVLFASRARATTIRPSSGGSTATPTPTLGSVLEAVTMGARRVVGAAWSPPSSAAPYLAAIATAELNNGIPQNLLARLLYQESAFRPDVISGAVVSSAGALGIAQIIPRWHPGVDPLDPFAAIAYAGRYLASLRQRFGTWDKALAAYNWGQGNLATLVSSSGAAWLDADELPSETYDYVAAITRDVPGALV